MNNNQTLITTAKELLAQGILTHREYKPDYQSCSIIENSEEAPFVDNVTLALFLGLIPQELEAFIENGCDKMYSTFFIDKRTHKIVPRNYPSKLREINAPNNNLKELQNKLIPVFAKFPVHPTNNGFVIGKSLLDAVKAVKEGELLIHVDLNKFFDNHKEAYVKEKLQEKFLETYKVTLPRETLNALSTLLTLRGKLPQGAPTSPCLVVALNFEMDEKITELATKYNLSYSRYADDLAFSGNISYATGRKFVTELKTIIQPFTINFDKLKFMRTSAKTILRYLEIKIDNRKGHTIQDILKPISQEFGETLSSYKVKQNIYNVFSNEMETYTRMEVENKLASIRTQLLEIANLEIKPKFYYIQSTKHILGVNIVDGEIKYPRKEYENMRLIALLLGRQKFFNDTVKEITERLAKDAEGNDFHFTKSREISRLNKLLSLLQLFAGQKKAYQAYRNLIDNPLDREHFTGVIGHIQFVDTTKGLKLLQIMQKGYVNCYKQFKQFVQEMDPLEQTYLLDLVIVNHK